MSTYFIFSDESGDYKPIRDEKYNSNTPFYIRSALIIDSAEWKWLSERYRDLKKMLNIPTEKEVKWQCLWQIRKFENDGVQIPKKCEFLRPVKYKNLESFIENAISLVQDLKYKKIIITITNNSYNFTFQKKELLKMHLQDIMERVELEFKKSENDLGIIFIDHVNDTIDKYLREIYSEFFRKEDFIEKYSHIIDSLSIEFSHHSAGIQIVDFISGCSLSVVRSMYMDNGSKKFEFSKILFKKNIFPYLRTGPNNELFGFGIKETPQNNEFRNELKAKFSEYIGKQVR